MNKINFIFCVIIFGVLQQYQNVGAIGERVVSQGLSPYLELVLCPGRQQPWSCARDQTARLLDEMNDIVKYQWQMLKVQADRELNTTLQQRGFSSTAVKEKPSTMLKKIEIGTNFIQNFVENTADVVMGRQSVDFYDEDDDDDDDDDDDEDEENENAVDNTNNSSKNKNSNQNHIERNQVGEAKKKGQVSHLQPAIVLLETQKPHQHLGGHGGHGGGHGGLGGHLGGHLLNGHKIGHKKKKKHPFGGGHGGLLGGGHGGIGGGGFTSLFHHNEIGTHALSFLEDLLDSGVSGKPHSHGLNSNNYGRSIGVGRGKKKKKKALMKLMLIGTIIKGKIELLLKILSAHLQVKFFAIALVGLIINIARFWIDIRRGGVPQKDDYIDVNDQAYTYSKIDEAQEAQERLLAVATTAGVAQKIFRHDQEMFGSYILPALLFNKVLEFPFTVIYYEHAHHQHHYEDHGNVAPSDDWTSATGPSSNSGYWKRSLGDKKREAKSFPPSEETSSSSSYSVPGPIYGANSEQYSAAYNSDPSYLAYSGQLPSYY